MAATTPTRWLAAVRWLTLDTLSACARGAAEDGGAHLPREAHCAADAGLGGEGDGDLLDGRVHGTAPVVLAGPLMLQSHLGVVELELEAALVRVVQVPAGEGDMMYRVT